MRMIIIVLALVPDSIELRNPSFTNFCISDIVQFKEGRMTQTKTESKIDTPLVCDLIDRLIAAIPVNQRHSPPSAETLTELADGMIRARDISYRRDEILDRHFESFIDHQPTAKWADLAGAEELLLRKVLHSDYHLSKKLHAKSLLQLSFRVHDSKEKISYLTTAANLFAEEQEFALAANAMRHVSIAETSKSNFSSGFAAAVKADAYAQRGVELYKNSDETRYGQSQFFRISALCTLGENKQALARSRGISTQKGMAALRSASRAFQAAEAIIENETDATRHLAMGAYQGKPMLLAGAQIRAHKVLLAVLRKDPSKLDGVVSDSELGIDYAMTKLNSSPQVHHALVQRQVQGLAQMAKEKLAGADTFTGATLYAASCDQIKEMGNAPQAIFFEWLHREIDALAL